MDIILASQSPRRRELISLLNLPFSTTSVDVDEEEIQDIDLVVNVQARAFLKGDALHKQLKHYSQLIMTADTTVALGNKMLNKPHDAAQAKEMLFALRGRTHEVHSGVAFLDSMGKIRHGFVNTAVVQMRPYREADIDAYIQTGDPLDKAGAYAIQHPTFKPVAQLDGCYLSVMGLPVCQIIRELQKWQIFAPYDLELLKDAHGKYENCPDLALLK